MVKLIKMFRSVPFRSVPFRSVPFRNLNLRNLYLKIILPSIIGRLGSITTAKNNSFNSLHSIEKNRPAVLPGVFLYFNHKNSNQRSFGC